MPLRRRMRVIALVFLLASAVRCSSAAWTPEGWTLSGTTAPEADDGDAGICGADTGNDATDCAD
jgi:hypothetical protein